jgi:ABC-type transport system involved in cytochrome c biogenesis permease subunit
LKTLDEFGYRFIAGGFVLLGLMLVSGSLWYHQLKGSYWSWDMLEVWSLCSWLVYGGYIFLRFAMGWRNRKMAWFALLALGIIIISYLGITVLNGGFHTGLDIRQK